MTRFALIALTRVLTGARARWRELPARDETVIYFANHTSHLDAVVVWSALPPSVRARTRPVGAIDYWTTNAIRRYFACRVLNTVLIERQKVTARNNPLQPMLAALEAGNSLIVFPEGTRSNCEQPGPFKSGIYHLAKARPDVCLRPVLLDNLNRVLPKGEFLPVPMLGSVTIGPLLRFIPGEERTTFLARAHRALCDLRETI
jgi:1-acyl-sn-glycerol-3-phosphate acyltransferase